MNKEARYWTPLEGKRVQCLLCPNQCVIASGKVGRCLGRKNIDGKLYAVNYGEVVSMAVDPIEKKPLYHYYPGAEIFSVATYGCNLLCPFCQNWEISQEIAPSRFISPQELLKTVKRSGVNLISYTYSEPLVWFEFLLDAGKLLKDAGIKNVLVTNGMINPEPLREILPLIDAMNIDLKSIREGFYRDYIKGDLPTVLETIRIAHKNCHIELTNLIIPGRNDSEAEIRELVDFVASLGRKTPLHFSRYFPRHRASEPVTPTETLRRAAEIAREKLDYVYLGNIAIGERYQNTFCPGCGAVLVDRSGYVGRLVGLKDGECQRCGRKADIVLC
ncbi:MAG: AmmeMemoRadiSam system radical SAM enzyme [candidate division WOR-3 bacterium]